MPRNTSEYQKQYRLKNAEKLKEVERLRSATRRERMKNDPKYYQVKECMETLDKFEAHGFDQRDMMMERTFHNCMASNCKSTEANHHQIDGCGVWLCDEHKPKK